MHPNAKLWGKTMLTDVTLRVYPAGHDEGSAAGDVQPVLQLRLHRFALAAASGYFFTRFENWDNTASEPSAKRIKAEPAATSDGLLLDLTLHQGEPASVVEAVLHHGYTGIVPDDPSLLVLMISRADYLDMPATMEACLARLSTLHNSSPAPLSVADVVLIHSLPALQASHNSAMAQQMSKLAGRVVAFHLGDTRQVLLDKQLLQQFVQLPFELLKQWAATDSIKVDSDDTVAVLLTAWYDHQAASAPAGSGPSEQQCKELSGFVCLEDTSRAFHLQAIPHLKWYRAPDGLPKQHALLYVLCDEAPSCYQRFLASGGIQGKRRPAKSQQLQLSVSRQQQETLWAGQSVLLEQHMYHDGFDVHIGLELKDKSGGKQLRVCFTVQWPEVLIKHGLAEKAPYPMASIKMDTKFGNGLGNHKCTSIVASADRKMGRAFSQVYSNLDDFVSAWDADKHIQIKLMVSDND